ncbi:hypothetical protein BD770DRAFT_477586 [Pilaira anomala]|nr:hypothetical protein BD770DRAFT_477586 [Pilaira anomala]
MSEVKTVIAHHPYEAEREDEISFEVGEVIKVTDISDPDWWVGKKKDGSLGFFPSNFVTVQEGEEKEQPKAETVDPKLTEKPTTTTDVESVKDDSAIGDTEASQVEEVEERPVEEKKVDKVIGMARVMEDYAMQEPGEISLHRGGIINVYEVIDPEWSRGELNGKIGRYPHKYVEDIDMPGRPDLGLQSTEPQKATATDEDAPKGGFKLAAFGVKQGGIGSLLAGGFPGLKKTGVKPQEKSAPAPAPAPAAAPAIPSAAAPTTPSADAPSSVVTPTTPSAATPPAVATAPTVASAPAVAPVSPAIPNTTPTVTDQQTSSSEATPKSLGKAIVLHPYDAESEDELSLLRGEYVEILDREVDEGWWKGMNERGQQGVFPFNFVRELEPESIAPPTPTRTRRSIPPRPASVQSPATTRPISVQAPAQRPSSISHTSSAAVAALVPPHIASPSISEEPNHQEEGNDEKEENVSSPTVQSPAQPASEPVVAAAAPAPAAAAEVQSPTEPAIQSPAKPAALQSPVEESPVQAKPEPMVERNMQPKQEEEQPPRVETEKEESTTDEPSSEPTMEAEGSVAKSIQSPPPPGPERNTSFSSEDSAKPSVQVPKELERVPSSPVVVKEEPISDEEEKESGVEQVSMKDVATSKEVIEEEEDKPKEEKEEEESEKEEAAATSVGEVQEKTEFGILPTGPKLTTPARARIGGNRARRSPQSVSQEPSQTQVLQKELDESPKEEEGGERTPPAKPVKPIFAKFPTPFAVGGDALSKAHLKPTQTRRLWEEKANEAAPSAHNNNNNTTDTTTTTTTEEERSAPVRPSGVKNIASRFNFSGGNSSSGNEVLETKLKNHTKNEVEKVRKEFEQLLNEEKEKRTALEQIVYDLLEKVQVLESQQQ